MNTCFSNSPCATSYRVIFGDTDAGGIVYHSRYLELAERGRNESMRQLKLDVGHLFAVGNLGFALRSCELKFLAPALFDDLLTIFTTLHKLRSASSVWMTRIKRGPVEICHVNAEIICMDRVRHQPTLFPQPVMTALQASARNKSRSVPEAVE